MSARLTRPRRGPAVERCPICGKPASAEDAPFCSTRCREVDLNRWLGGAYRIPGEAVREPGGSDDED
ncbi:DNA gyrase inhibitor YacG [Afifella sp. JA880]|uniref:DNA gyrase inhibitor YacG n=1 Tax=Afifella sp. JA880 TaxID=2975280 RepID=UPI0021BA932B|nr:DNA gyrase inhibitor YacG [Afifella sp. JA880]MCT8267196.1 DNA gyrase inhibitor YacG [Afifella sp. JA880]